MTDMRQPAIVIRQPEDIERLIETLSRWRPGRRHGMLVIARRKLQAMLRFNKITRIEYQRINTRLSQAIARTTGGKRH